LRLFHSAWFISLQFSRNAHAHLLRTYPNLPATYTPPTAFPTDMKFFKLLQRFARCALLLPTGQARQTERATRDTLVRVSPRIPASSGLHFTFIPTLLTGLVLPPAIAGRAVCTCDPTYVLFPVVLPFRCYYFYPTPPPAGGSPPTWTPVGSRCISPSVPPTSGCLLVWFGLLR